MPNISLQPSGRSFPATPAESILEAALRANIGLSYSCRSGQCGSCKAYLRSGTAHYPLAPPAALSVTEQQAGAVLLCQLHADSDLSLEVREVPVLAGIQPTFYPARAHKLTRLAPDVMQLELHLPHNRPFAFKAGQYLEFVLPDGQRRAFSLANRPDTQTNRLELHIRRVPGGKFTGYIFDELKEKAILRIYGPLGTFFLRDNPKPAILVGGGTGFAPLKGMLESAFAAGDTRPLHLYWGIRAQRDCYLDLPRQWAATYPQFRYTPVLSEPTLGEVWLGRTGWVHAAVVADYPDLSQHEVYLSGPPPMVRAGQQAFAACGLPPDALHFDSFEFALPH